MTMLRPFEIAAPDFITAQGSDIICYSDEQDDAYRRLPHLRSAPRLRVKRGYGFQDNPALPSFLDIRADRVVTRRVNGGVAAALYFNNTVIDAATDSAGQVYVLLGEDPVEYLPKTSLFATADGETSIFTAALTTPVQAGSVVVTGTTELARDDGLGALVGAQVASATIDYYSGELAIEFVNPIWAGMQLYVNYRYAVSRGAVARHTLVKYHTDGSFHWARDLGQPANHEPAVGEVVVCFSTNAIVGYSAVGNEGWMDYARLRSYNDEGNQLHESDLLFYFTINDAIVDHDTAFVFITGTYNVAMPYGRTHKFDTSDLAEYGAMGQHGESAQRIVLSQRGVYVWGTTGGSVPYYIVAYTKDAEQPTVSGYTHGFFIDIEATNEPYQSGHIPGEPNVASEKLLLGFNRWNTPAWSFYSGYAVDDVVEFPYQSYRWRCIKAYGAGEAEVSPQGDPEHWTWYVYLPPGGKYHHDDTQVYQYHTGDLIVDANGSSYRALQDSLAADPDTKPGGASGALYWQKQHDTDNPWHTHQVYFGWDSGDWWDGDIVCYEEIPGYPVAYRCIVSHIPQIGMPPPQAPELWWRIGYYTVWNPTHQYVTEDIVRYHGKRFRCQTDCPTINADPETQNPEIDTTNWRQLAMDHPETYIQKIELGYLEQDIEDSGYYAEIWLKEVPYAITRIERAK